VEAKLASQPGPAAATPATTPFATAPSNSLSDLTAAQLVATAPDHVCAAVNLPPGSIYAACLVQRSLLLGIEHGDTAAIRDIVEKISRSTQLRDENTPPSMRVLEMREKLLGPSTQEERLRGIVALVREWMEGTPPPSERVALTVKHLLAVIEGREKEFEVEFAAEIKTIQ
jgi:hypothetical protein